MEIIAEVKTSSPFRWHSDRSWEELFEIADRIGDMISVHTDPRWSGSFDLVKRARELTNKPILAKGIHRTDDEIKMAIDAGADKVLVVGRLPGVYVDQCLLEPNDLNGLLALPEGSKAVWNSRDLETGRLKPAGFGVARNFYSGWLCQASNIRGIYDVDTRADSILVGTHLPSFASQVELAKKEGTYLPFDR